MHMQSQSQRRSRSRSRPTVPAWTNMYQRERNGLIIPHPHFCVSLTIKTLNNQFFSSGSRNWYSYTDYTMKYLRKKRKNRRPIKVLRTWCYFPRWLLILCNHSLYLSWAVWGLWASWHFVSLDAIYALVRSIDTTFWPDRWFRNQVLFVFLWPKMEESSLVRNNGTRLLFYLSFWDYCAD